MRLGSDAVAVCGQFVLGGPDRAYQTTTFFTIVFQRVDGELKIIHQHHSYEFTQKDTENKDGALNMELNTTQFVKNLFWEHHTETQIPIKSGRQTLYVNPSSVLYVQSQGKRTELICADRLISCSNSISELSQLLPADFYPVHRGYLVNIRYITALRRFEVELVSGITIPVPARTYMKVKKDFHEKFKLPSARFQRN